VQLRLERFYSGIYEFDDASLKEMVAKLYGRLFNLERSKSTSPRFTEAVKDLAKLFGILPP
jgi:hypothetical protein